MASQRDNVRSDLKAMRAAVQALDRIPTATRRRVALEWVAARCLSDIARLRAEEKIEKVADFVGVVMGEASGSQSSTD